MTSLYEDLLNEKPKVWLRAKRNREIRNARDGEKYELDEEDKLLTPEEVKAKRLKRQLKEWKDRFLIKEKQWQKEWNEKYWLSITRTFVYLKEDFWKWVSETYHELEADSHNLPDISLSENDMKDLEYLRSHKYDWAFDWHLFWMSWFNWFTRISMHRKTWRICSPIKLIPTYSLDITYSRALSTQAKVWKHLEGLSKERGMSVQAFVEWGYRDEDVLVIRRRAGKSVRMFHKAREGSWLEEAISWLKRPDKIVAMDYIRMIRDWIFTLGEVCIPFRTYIVGDYVFFGNCSCAVPSMFGNGEFFSEKNRETIHHWWRYITRNRVNIGTANTIPVFYWDNMKLVRVSDVKIDDEDTWWNNNGSYSFYLVPPTKYLWYMRNNSMTMQNAIDRFRTVVVEEMPVYDKQPKTELNDANIPKRSKNKVFYFNTEEDLCFDTDSYTETEMIADDSSTTDKRRI